jgi:hypothetical protein
MTTPHERTRSIRRGFELLGEVRLDESINVSLRDPARGLRAMYQATTMRSTSLYLKHMGSRLPDAFFDVAIDDDGLLVVVRAKPFDSALLACLVTRVLPEDFGVISFDDDNFQGQGQGQGRARYRLEVHFDGLRFNAVVTKTLTVLSLGVTVGLRRADPC